MGRRDDGYHLLESLVVHTTDVGDGLSVQAADTLTLDLEGEHAPALTDEGDNLVLRAARLLDPTRTARLTLTKTLPVASGIGGGSSDAAACLRLLNEFWCLGKSRSELGDLGAQLGADVPMCIDPAPTFVTGIGDVLEPVTVPPLHLVLVNPGVAISTPTVFSRYQGEFERSAAPPAVLDDCEAVADYARRIGNDLYRPACSVAPVIADVTAALGALRSCLYTAMSGSGATCFGLFGTRADADKAAYVIEASHPTWWVRAATTRGSQT